MKNKDSSPYYKYRLKLEKLKQNREQWVVFARILVFLEIMARHLW